MLKTLLKIVIRSGVVLFILIQWLWFFSSPQFGSFPVGPHAREVLYSENFESEAERKKALNDAWLKDDKEQFRKDIPKNVLSGIVNLLFDIVLVYALWDVMNQKKELNQQVEHTS